MLGHNRHQTTSKETTERKKGIPAGPPAKQMSTTGTVAPNFHEGTRSEYLAQYVFSAFGTSIPVPHPEDAGIDLYCTLGERMGQRLHVQNYYFVQVKSEKQEIRYDGKKSVEWALSHRYPLLICYVDKRQSRFEIFQTLKLTMCHAKRGITSLTLIPGPDPNNQAGAFSDVTASPDLRLYLHHPILQFSLSEMQDQTWFNNAVATLKSWVELDQENIGLKPTGVSLFRVPTSYAPNQPLGGSERIVGNFRDVNASASAQMKFNNVLFRLLAQLVHQTAAERNVRMFGLLADFVGNFISQLPLRASPDVVSIAAAVNTGAKHVGHPGRISLTGEGKTITPVLEIKS